MSSLRDAYYLMASKTPSKGHTIVEVRRQINPGGWVADFPIAELGRAKTLCALLNLAADPERQPLPADEEKKRG